MTPSLTIFIGASAGGVLAVQKILQDLPKLFTPAIVVAQHLPADSVINHELAYGRYSSLKLVEAVDKMPIDGGHVYFAPPAYHLLIERDRTFSLSQDEPVNFARPSIDVLFESAAWALGPNSCGVLLTGANSDGARGLLKIKEVGGATIVQDPSDAEISTMPKSAIELFKPSFVLNLAAISKKLTELSRDVET
jgi:two-component system chemotaxis response regulator CheB